MAAPDMDVIKEIPGYKVILKAILKSQIQQLVEQLASHTSEESIILTASISDGTLSHLGSDSGKFFLEDHEDIKSQFLGFCLKHHHRKKEKEKEEQELQRQQEEEKRRHERQMQMMSQHPRFGPRPGFMSRSPRFSPRFSPRQPMRSPGMRHEPYPVSRPMKRPLNFDSPAGPGNGHMRLPVGGGGAVNNKVIKIESEDPDSNESAGDSNVPSAAGEIPSGDEANKTSSSQPSSPSHSSVPSSNLKSEHGDKDDDARSESSSTSAAAGQASDRPPSDIGTLDTGLSLDSDFSNLISGEVPSTSAAADNSDGGMPQTPTDTSDVDPNVNIKLEAITESEMELEITGVEPGPGRAVVNPGMGSQHDAGATNWSPDMQGSMGAMGFDPSDIAGSQSGMPDQGYNSEMVEGGSVAQQQTFTDEDGTANRMLAYRHCCQFCGRGFQFACHLRVHMRIHTGAKPFQCPVCCRQFTQKNNLNVHLRTHTNY